MDLLWLVIPAAIVIFLVRIFTIARSLKMAAAAPTLADVRAFREAKRSLKVHRERLEEAVGQPSLHLDAAKRLASVPKRHSSSRSSQTADVPEDAAGDPSATSP